jgi:hypothetical protein
MQVRPVTCWAWASMIFSYMYNFQRYQTVSIGISMMLSINAEIPYSGWPASCRNPIGKMHVCMGLSYIYGPETGVFLAVTSTVVAHSPVTVEDFEWPFATAPFVVGTFD